MPAGEGTPGSRLFDSVIVRPPTKDLTKCVSTHPFKDTLDMNLALKQHEEYIKILREEGIHVYTLPQLEGSPDSVFIQDTAIVRSSKRQALISRFGEAKRRGEEDSVENFLKKAGFTTHRVGPPATLEGGDVLITNIGMVYVGMTSRTNSFGIEALRHFLEDHKVIAVPTSKVFHLLSAVNYIGNKAVAIVPELVDPLFFEGFTQIRVPLEEAYAANMLYLGDNKILLPEGYPKTVERLRSSGYRVIEVDVSEFRKCDGGVTCLSLPLYLI
ncbi:MAG: arginine deiminase family protein [Zestosphaera sp.]